jgi:hypothetical protein
VCVGGGGGLNLLAAKSRCKQGTTRTMDSLAAMIAHFKQESAVIAVSVCGAAAAASKSGLSQLLSQSAVQLRHSYQNLYQNLSNVERSM